MSMAERTSVEIGAGWNKVSAKGMEYISLSIGGGLKAVMFRNTQKKSEKQPDWRIMSDEEELVLQFGREKQDPPPQSHGSQPESTRQPMTKMDDDVPF
jgi:uncharacterized protein (DUF736 family)